MAAKIIDLGLKVTKIGDHIKKPNNFKSKFGVLNLI